MSFMDAIAGGVGSAVGGSVGGAAASALTGSLFGGQPSGAESGRSQRAYLDAAFPELNAWEKAGAGQTGNSAATNTAATSERNADKANALQYSMMNSQIEKTKAETALTNQRTKNEATATSPIGRTVKDVSQIASDAWNGVKGAASNLINPAKPSTEKERMHIDMSRKQQRLDNLQAQYKKAATADQKALILKRIQELKRN